MNTFFNEAELLAEHQAQVAEKLREAEAIEAAEREKRNKEFAAQRETERAKKNALVERHLNQIALHLPRDMFAVVKNGEILIDGFRPWWEFKERYTSSGWRSKPTGTFQFSVGDYGERKVFPQRKDGSFSYLKISQEMVDSVRVAKARKQRNDAQKTNEQVADAVREEFGFREWSSNVTASTEADKPIHLQLSINHAFTVDRAFEILTILSSIPEFGIKKGAE